jgi:5-methylcytosine-specific restriction protein A
MTISDLPTKGQKLTSEDIRQIFQCSVYGGMNRSLKTNSLVLVSNHVKSIYDDRWVDGVLHYTGMGQLGDQSIKTSQNKTLAESAVNGVQLHLFEVHKPKEYVYQGQVELAGEPYTERQPDSSGQEREVVVFQLKLVDSEGPVVMSETDYTLFTKERERKVSTLSKDELERRALKARTEPGKREVLSTQYERDPYVARFIKLRANGCCDLCGQEAPFLSKDGTPYLESHHVVWRKHNGPDTPQNTVALCPNCHRRMHVLDSDIDKQRLLEKIKSYGD